MYYQKNNYYTNAKKQNGYDSKFEAGYAQELELRKKAGDIKNWEAQKTLDLIVNKFKVCTYKIDFIVYHHDGTIEYIETKGYATPVWRLKWKLFEACYSDLPNVKLTVIYQGKGKPPKAKRIKTITLKKSIKDLIE
jgi:hypothetical protein